MKQPLQSFWWFLGRLMRARSVLQMAQRAGAIVASEVVIRWARERGSFLASRREGPGSRERVSQSVVIKHGRMLGVAFAAYSCGSSSGTIPFSFSPVPVLSHQHGKTMDGLGTTWAGGKAWWECKRLPPRRGQPGSHAAPRG